MIKTKALRLFFIDETGGKYLIAPYTDDAIEESLQLCPRGAEVLLVNFDKRPLDADDLLFQAIRRMPLPDKDYVDHIRATVVGEDCVRIHDLIDEAIIERALAEGREPFFMTGFDRFCEDEDRRQFGAHATATEDGLSILVRGTVAELAEVAGGVVQRRLESEFSPADWRYGPVVLAEMEARGIEPEPPPVLRRFFITKDGINYYIGFYNVLSLGRVFSEPERYALKIVNCEPSLLGPNDWFYHTVADRFSRPHLALPMFVSGRLAEESEQILMRLLKDSPEAKSLISVYDCVDLRDLARRCAVAVDQRDQAILVRGDHQELGFVAGEVVAILLGEEFSTSRSEVREM